MSDFLTHLLQRSLGGAAMVEPMTPSRFASNSGQVPVKDREERTYADVTPANQAADVQAVQTTGITSQTPAPTTEDKRQIETVQRKAVSKPFPPGPKSTSRSDTVIPATDTQPASPQTKPEGLITPRTAKQQKGRQGDAYPTHTENLESITPLISPHQPERPSTLGATREVGQASEQRGREDVNLPSSRGKESLAAMIGNTQEAFFSTAVPNQESRAAQRPKQGDRELRRGRINPLPMDETASQLPVSPANPVTPPGMGGREAAHSAGEAVPPRIEVTIGRIEVRAQVIPQAQAARPQTRTPPLSLADYLQSRDGGGK